jgi:hypothetical protein
MQQANPTSKAQASIVAQRKEGLFTITTWSDGRRTFSVPGDKVRVLRIAHQNQTAEVREGR